MNNPSQAMWVPVKEILNESLLWLGLVKNPDFEVPEGAEFIWGHIVTDFDPPWYHCRPCIENGARHFEARLSVGAKFCSHCGNKIDWDYGEDPFPTED